MRACRRELVVIGDEDGWRIDSVGEDKDDWCRRKRLVDVVGTRGAKKIRMCWMD